MKTKLSRFYADEYLYDEAGFALLLDDAVETGDSGYIAHALGTVARSRGMTIIAKEAGVSRKALYKALSELDNSELPTLLAVIEALKLKMKSSLDTNSNSSPQPGGAAGIAAE